MIKPLILKKVLKRALRIIKREELSIVKIRKNLSNILSCGILTTLCCCIFLASLSWADKQYPTSPTSEPPSHIVPDRPPDPKNTPRHIGNAPFDGIPKESEITESDIGKIIKLGVKEYCILGMTPGGEMNLMPIIQMDLNKIEDPECLKQMKRDLEEISVEQQRLVKKMALKPEELQCLKQISSMVSQVKGTNEIKAKFADFVMTKVKDSSWGGTTDINAIIQYVLREAYLDTQKDLEYYAEKVKYFNSLKKSIRDNITRSRDSKTPFRKMVLPKYPNTELVPDPGSNAKITSKDEIENYAKSLEQKLNEVGEDQQLAQIDLQNKLQYSQQLLQTLSNVSKMMYDTIMGIIRKIGG